MPNHFKLNSFQLLTNYHTELVSVPQALRTLRFQPEPVEGLCEPCVETLRSLRLNLKLWKQK